MFDSKRRLYLEGRIAGTGFASGDRFVAGLWERGPLGAMTDVMWARPDGARVLLAPTEEVAAFISDVYEFDDVRVVPVALKDGQAIEIEAGPVALSLTPGPPARAFALRPRALRRSLPWVAFEDSVLRPLVGRLVLKGAAGVRARGRSTSGVREWYRIDAYRPVTSAHGSIDGRDLGPMAPLDPPVQFGFSEFPRYPAVVDCAPVLEFSPRARPAEAADGERARR